MKGGTLPAFLAALLAMAVLLSGPVPAVVAGMGLTPQKSFAVGEKSRAVSLAVSGRELFVLHADGRVSIYDLQGQWQGEVNVGDRAAALAAAANGRQLFVLDRNGRKVEGFTVWRREKFAAVKPEFVRGPSRAPVTIVVFSDFQCPYCARLNQVLEEVLQEYPTQVKLEYKFFPLTSIHKQAMPAALAAQAAGRQGKFWEYHDALLASFSDLSEARFREIAERLGLDMQRFARERKDPRLVNVVHRDIREARQHHIDSVPTVYVNGLKVGRRTRENFERLIREELRRRPGMAAGGNTPE